MWLRLNKKLMNLNNIVAIVALEKDLYFIEPQGDRHVHHFETEQEAERELDRLCSLLAQSVFPSKPLS